MSESPKPKPEVPETEPHASSRPARPPLVPTGLNGGRLFAGGVPGNRGGRGRPPKAIVRQVGEDLAVLVARLKERVRNKRTSTRDLVQIGRFFSELAAQGKAQESDTAPPIAVLSRDEAGMTEHLAEQQRQEYEAERRSLEEAGPDDITPEEPAA
jgi:hypothetical protein